MVEHRKVSVFHIRTGGLTEGKIESTLWFEVKNVCGLCDRLEAVAPDPRALVAWFRVWGLER